jgi:hypothetical protein
VKRREDASRVNASTNLYLLENWLGASRPRVQPFHFLLQPSSIGTCTLNVQSRSPLDCPSAVCNARVSLLCQQRLIPLCPGPSLQGSHQQIVFVDFVRHLLHFFWIPVGKHRPSFEEVCVRLTQPDRKVSGQVSCYMVSMHHGP